MRKQKHGRLCAAITAAMLLTQTGGFPQRAKVSALESYRNAVVQNQGSAAGDAVIRGRKAAVVHDADLNSDVLQLQGGSHGEGWLQLPKLFEQGCTDGFSFSMRYQLDADAVNYTRLFQFSSIPLGSGNSSYNSPDISIDLNNKSAYRASVFAGKNTTENDEKHRAIFTLSEKPDSGKWHQVTVVYSKSGANYYLDGTLLDTIDADTLTDSVKSLFSENLLSSYIYNGVGHSLYQDPDLYALVDDVAFYDYALTDSQVRSLPDDAAFLYTFEEDTLKEGEPVTATEESGVSPGGAAITSIPELQTSSPDGSLVAKIWKDGSGRYYYSVEKDEGSVIQPSLLGLVTSAEDLSTGFSCDPADAEKNTLDETYSQITGKHTTVRNHYNEVVIPLKKGNSTLSVFVRVYDDGMAVRYALNHGATIKSEATQIVFADNSTFWGNLPNATYEWDIVETNTQKMRDAWADYSCPLTGQIAGRYWVVVSEANVFNEENPYCANVLSTSGGSSALNWKFGVKTKSVTMSGSWHTPWRAVVIGDTLDQMANSDLILNLNPPSVLEDTSWIKPGKAAWSWWSSGGDSPVEYPMQKEYIDFAADNGWDNVCVDFGWALWDNSAEKIKELCDYGAKKGIDIWLWYGVNNSGHSGYKDSAGHPAYPYYSLLDEATIKREFERVSGLGVKGVKVDYYESDTQETMKQMYLCMKIAAENHLMVLFHGCTIPKGETRTYPNVISYEAVNGAEYYKWFTSPSLQNRITYVFSRCVIGSADFTPPCLPVFNSQATAGFALADAVTIESGVQHFCHSVYTYEGTKALALLNDIPVAWDELRILDGRPMQFNVTARRSGNDWYIGSATINARNISVKLSDLVDDDGIYTAYIFRDNEDGTDLVTEVRSGLTKDSVLTESLMKNGGVVIKLTKGSMKLDTLYSNYRFYEAEKAALSGQASITSGKDARYCSGQAYVGYVGGNANNYITFSNVNAPAEGDYDIRIYYISGESRSLKIDVNGSFAKQIDGCYANKGDWSGIRAVSVTVHLSAGQNTVKLYNDKGYGPSIDRIALCIPNEELLYGDLNFDQKIDARDLSLLKSGLLYGFKNDKVERVSDMNRDGTVTKDDAVSMMNFLTVQS